MANSHELKEDLSTLFADLKSKPTDNSIDTSTFIALLQRLGFDKSQKSFFNYIWKKISVKKVIQEKEFVDLFDKPKNTNLSDAEELTYVRFFI